MQVTNLKVGFSRLRRPADFEHQNPNVEFTATLDDGDDAALAARTLMIDAVTVSYNALGYDVPAKIAQALAEGKAPAGGTVETETEEATQEASEAAEPAKKPRGRPAGSKNTRPKKNTKAAKEAEEAQKAAIAAEAEKATADDSDGIPDDDKPAMPQISTNPENRVDPDADSIPDDDDKPAAPAAEAEKAAEEDNGIPDDTEVASTGATETVDLTANDLNVMIGSALKANKLSLPDARSITRHFKVARVHDLSPEQVVQARDMLEKMMEAKS